MFARKYRYSFKKGLPKHIISTPFFTLRYGINSFYRLQCAVVVSKKVDKKATERNKLKRRFIHALRQILADTEKPYSFVFFLKKDIKDSTFEEMKQDIQKTLAIIKL